MSITFTEEENDLQLLPSRRSRTKKGGLFTRLVQSMSFGLVKTDTQASVVLIMLAVLLLFAAVFIVPKQNNALPPGDMHTIDSPDGKPYYPKR